MAWIDWPFERDCARVDLGCLGSWGWTVEKETKLSVVILCVCFVVSICSAKAVITEDAVMEDKDNGDSDGEACVEGSEGAEMEMNNGGDDEMAGQQQQYGGGAVGGTATPVLSEADSEDSEVTLVMGLGDMNQEIVQEMVVEPVEPVEPLPLPPPPVESQPEPPSPIQAIDINTTPDARPLQGSPMTPMEPGAPKKKRRRYMIDHPLARGASASAHSPDYQGNMYVELPVDDYEYVYDEKFEIHFTNDGADM